MIDTLHEGKKLFAFLLRKSLKSLMPMLCHRPIKLTAQTMSRRCHRYIIAPVIFHTITLNNMLLLQFAQCLGNCCWLHPQIFTKLHL